MSDNDLKKKKRAYKSDILAAVHEDAEALHRVGAIDKKTMREFDAACLMPIEEFTPDAVRRLREKEQVSQPVFAQYMNVSKGMVSSWERGTKKPSGAALRLLSIIKRSGLDSIA